MKTLAVIPARYASTRFPGKPLALIHDKPMIQWVYERCLSCPAICQTVVATDDPRIGAAVEAFGGQVVMTSPDHQSGTDRVAEAVSKLDSAAELIINVQGDEPGMNPEHLAQLIALFSGDIDIATLVTPFRDLASFRDPNRVKAALGQDGRALYFSRSAIPHDRDDESSLSNSYQHLGVYAYRSSALVEITQLAPSPLELKESLEQLRWLENGFRIGTLIVDSAPIGVDRPEDLERVKDQIIGN